MLFCLGLIGNQSQGKKETEICVDREIDKERKAKQSKSDLKLHTYLSKLAFLLITTIIYCQSITRMGNRKWQQKLLTMSLTYNGGSRLSESFPFLTDLYNFARMLCPTFLTRGLSRELILLTTTTAAMFAEFETEQ